MQRLRRVLFSVVLATATTSAAAAPAQPKKDKGAKVETPADVETAEQLYAKLDYEKANEVAERVTKQRNLTHDQLIRAYKILAITNAILDKEEAARDAFLQLLVFDPEYTVDTALGPKVSTPFIEARGQFRSLPTKPGIEVVASVRSDGGQLRVTTRDPTHIVKKVSVGYRWTSSGEYTVTQLSVGEGTVEVAAAAPGRTRLDFYAQALDERDNAVFEAGSPQVPKSAFAEAGPRPPPPGGKTGGEEKGGSVFSSPFFWIFAGAAIAGGGTALFFALRPDPPPTEASLTPVLRCGGELCK
jgi:lipoprotein-anchoring transpeptidase ErfK/SrfK